MMNTPIQPQVQQQVPVYNLQPQPVIQTQQVIANQQPK